MKDRALPVKTRSRPFRTSFIAGIVVIVGLAFSLRGPREPATRGKPLSHWLERLQAAKWSGDNEGGERTAEQAIREIGPAAVPVLLSKVRAKEGYRDWIAGRWNRHVLPLAPERWRPRLEMEMFPARRLHAQARDGFRLLGTNAAAAVPDLRELLRDHPRIWIVIGCLQEVQTDEALKALIPLLSHSNPKVRQEALFAVLEFGKRADVAGEEIARLADDENEDTVRRATIYAGDFLPADRAIPLLVRKLKDPRPRIARAALDSFIGRGPAAEPVMPVIAEALTSADEKTRKAATNALVTINPYRACEFGIDTNGTSEWVYRSYQDVRQRLATNASSGRSW